MAPFVLILFLQVDSFGQDRITAVHLLQRWHGRLSQLGLIIKVYVGYMPSRAAYPGNLVRLGLLHTSIYLRTYIFCSFDTFSGGVIFRSACFLLPCKFNTNMNKFSQVVNFACTFWFLKSAKISALQNIISTKLPYVPGLSNSTTLTILWLLLHCPRLMLCNRGNPWG